MERLTILVVDDEADIRDLIKDALSNAGHDVLCGQNGQEAVSLIAREHVDVVFLDIRMPHGDGITALREIVRIKPSLPVVMITGCQERDLIAESMVAGSCLCLMKPFSIRDIVATLRMLDVGLESDAA